MFRKRESVCVMRDKGGERESYIRMEESNKGIRITIERSFHLHAVQSSFYTRDRIVVYKFHPCRNLPIYDQPPGLSLSPLPHIHRGRKLTRDHKRLRHPLPNLRGFLRDEEPSRSQGVPDGSVSKLWINQPCGNFWFRVLPNHTGKPSAKKQTQGANFVRAYL